MKIDKVNTLLQQIMSSLKEVKNVDPELLELEAIDALCERIMDELSIMQIKGDISIEKDKHEIRESLLSMFFLGNILGRSISEEQENKEENKE